MGTTGFERCRAEGRKYISRNWGAEGRQIQMEKFGF
jgi:hypothetical protein